MDKKTSASGGIGFTGLLAIVFITLKLCKVITWSWWWVTCPLWAVPALIAAGILLFLLFGTMVLAWQSSR